MTIKRIFMATINADHPQAGMIHAFEGIFGKENVRHFDFLDLARRTNWGIEHVNGEFIRAAIDFKPDWMFLQLQNSNVITPESIELLREKIPHAVFVHWSGDVREKVGSYFAGICKATHLTLAANVGHLKKYEEAGARETMYVAHGLDWSEDVLGLPAWEPPFPVPEIVYCGNHYGDQVVGTEAREKAVRALFEEKLPIGVVGSGWEKTGLPVIGSCHVKQQVHVYRKAKVALSINHFPDLAGYHGDRTITAMASGTAVITRHFPMIEKEFSEGVHLLVFRSEQELVEKTRQLLEDEALRKALGTAGRHEVILHHTWFSRILQVLPRVEEIHATLLEKKP